MSDYGNLSEAERARMVQLIGFATVAMQSGQFTDADREHVGEMIGTLATVASVGKLIDANAALSRRLALLENQVAELQRSHASTN